MEESYEMVATYEKNLPYPYVLYPSGTFISFKKNKDSEHVFCSCFIEAIKNYLKLRILSNLNDYAEPTRNHILSSWDFPLEITQNAIKNNFKQDETIINNLVFKDKICHKCNKQMPSPNSCHSMYGSLFKQKYGWYIKLKYYENGIEPYTFGFISELCSKDLLDLVDFRYVDLFEIFREYKELTLYNDEAIKNFLIELDNSSFQGVYKYPHSNIMNSSNYHLVYKYPFSYIYEKVNNKLLIKINNFIENQIRLEFDVNLIGDKWTSETILSNIVKSLFPNQIIKRHFRPQFLNNLELDIFIKDLSIGIEYQGIQHYKVVKHWGGKPGLEKRKINDKLKKELCEKNGIKLVYFLYNEDLSNEIVYNRIKEYL